MTAIEQMREDAAAYLDATVQLVECTYGLSDLRTRTVESETVVATVKGRLQRGAGQVNASERTQQGGVRRAEGYSLRVPFGTPIPTEGKAIVTHGEDTFTFEITGHDPLRSDAVLLTVWIVATEGITN